MMILPTVKRNTFVEPEGKTYVDILSKVFVYSQLFLGVNRVPIICDKKCFFPLFCIYALIMNVFVCYTTLDRQFLDNLLVPVRCSRVFQYLISAVFSYFVCKRFRCYYKEIERFDNEVRCRPKYSSQSIKLIVAFLLLSVLTYFIMPEHHAYAIILHSITALDYFYFGHLINFITTRMRLLNYYLECSNSIAKTESSPDVSEFSFFEHGSHRFPSMCEILNLYQMMITAHKCLVDAVKWLMVTLVVLTFIYILVALFSAILMTMESANSLQFDYHYMLVVTSFLPLFIPCMSSNYLEEQVYRFRELLSSSLYESKLDRASRRTTRTLLDLSEIRDLSFSLLRILDISVSLPFSFLGLIITYLIILLQFRKVIFT